MVTPLLVGCHLTVKTQVMRHQASCDLKENLYPFQPQHLMGQLQ